MAVVTNRVGVDGTGDAFGSHARQSGGENVVAASAGFHFFQQQFLHAVGIVQTGLQTGGCFGLTRL